MDLNLHLEEFSELVEVGAAAKALQRELKRRFKKFTDPSDCFSEHLFLLATSLDPRYRFILNSVQTSAAKAELMKEIKALINNGSSPHEGHSPQHEIGEEISTDEAELVEPPTKKFRHLNKVLEKKWKEGIRRMAKHLPGEEQVKRYFASVEALEQPGRQVPTD